MLLYLNVFADRLQNLPHIQDLVVLLCWIIVPSITMKRFTVSLKKSVVCACRYPTMSLHILTSYNAGARLIYLPPYSLDFNPIEQAFHSIKAWLRWHKAEATLPEVRPWLIQQAAMSVSAKDTEGWIFNCRYSYE